MQMPSSSGEKTRLLLRPTGEMAIKSRRTRRRFQGRLLRNIEDALRSAGIEFTFQTEWGRIFLTASSPIAAELLSHVFGIASLSVVEATTEPELRQIIEVGERVYADRIRGRTFAVRARRTGRHPFSSRDVNYDLGAALVPYGAVNLDDPEITVHVEIRDDAAYFFSEQIRGSAGLPLGVEGRALALISGGYDSAVAAWMMMRRGVELDFAFCNLAGAAYERAVLGVTKQLTDEWAHGTRPSIHVIDFEPAIRALNERVRQSYWQVVLKRLMYRAAERIANEIDAEAIITGESVGQVSSQTLVNLRAIGECIDLPVLRPLVGFEKEEIIARSREIGTYPLSEKVREYCALVPGRPVTESSPQAAAREESKLDLSVLELAVAKRRVLDLRSLAITDLVMPYLYRTDVPPGAAVIDARSEALYRDWHYPGAERRDDRALLRELRTLERDRTYVLYCELGLKTAHLAERLQREGLEAYSFKGGAAAIRRYAETARAEREATRTP